MRLVCKYCGSDEIESYDTVIALARVNNWTRDADGVPVPEYAGGSEVFWDTQSPVDPALPYQCGECREQLAPTDLIEPTED
jgi:hypothetical protein